MSTPSPEAVQSIVSTCLAAVLDQRGIGRPATLDRDTPMFGSGGLLDSMGIVTLVVDVEQTLDADLGLAVSLADDRAMSQRSSPFRSVGALTDYILAQARGEV